MEQFIKYIDESVDQLQQEEKELCASDRKDEANLVKIRMNVYEICKTIFNVVKKTKEGNELKDTYLQKLTNLPQNWIVSYEKAKEHKDTTKVVIEEIKLETLETVKKKFIESWGN